MHLVAAMSAYMVQSLPHIATLQTMVKPALLIDIYEYIATTSGAILCSPHNHIRFPCPANLVGFSAFFGISLGQATVPVCNFSLIRGHRAFDGITA
jgi:hypothetical protein